MYLAVFVSFPVSAASIGSVRETYSWSGLGLFVMYLGVNYLKVKGSPKKSLGVIQIPAPPHPRWKDLSSDLC